MKTVFFGTSSFAIPTLSKLLKSDYDVTAIVTTSDKPAGRKQLLSPPPVKKFLQDNENTQIKLLQPTSLKTQEIVDSLRKIEADFFVVTAYGKIIPKEILDIPKHGVINIHPSLLPLLRGPSPIQTAILDGNTETGITIMLLDEKMDHGSILAQEKFPIPENATYTELHDVLAEKGAQLLINTLPQWLDENLVPKEQDHHSATYTKLLKKEDGHIQWEKSAEEIERMVRALNPWPSTYTYFENMLLKIKKVSAIEPLPNKEPGFVFIHEEFPAVVCGEKAILLELVQPESKQEMTGDSFIKGHPNFVGSNIKLT
jgi:methionyl-tRNA formyltransferase